LTKLLNNFLARRKRIEVLIMLNSALNNPLTLQTHPSSIVIIRSRHKMDLPADPIELIVNSLGHQDPMVRKSMARYLVGHISDVDVPRVIESFDEETHPEVVKWLARALGLTGRPSALKALEKKREFIADEMALDWICASISLGSNPEPKTLVGLISSNDRQAREEGVILSWGADMFTENVELGLVALLEDEPPKIRRWSELSLYHHGKLIDADRVSHNLLDQDFRLREWTAHVLTPLASSRLRPRLLDMFEYDDSPRVREWVARALARYAECDVRAVVTHRWFNESDPFVREAIVIGIITGPRLPKDQQFLISVLETETWPLVIGEMVRAIVKSPDFVADEHLMVAVERATMRMKDALDIPHLFARDLALTAKEHDKRVLSQYFKSPVARLLLGTFASTNMKEPSIPTVALVIALDEEFDCVFHELKALGTLLEATVDSFTGRTVYKAVHRFPEGHKINLNVVVLGGKGPVFGAVEATHLALASRPSIFAVIGIAGALSNSVRLCDTVVATYIDNYIENSKAVQSNDGVATLMLAGESFRSDPLLLDRARNLRYTASARVESIQSKKHELLTQAFSQVSTTLTSEQLVDEHICHIGPIASGPIVGSAPAFTHWLLQRNREYVAIEMESGGVAASNYVTSGLSGTRLLVVRGISDFADERKKTLDKVGNGVFRKVATTVALHTLLAILDVSKDAMAV
jgi:nucleoside phosphorylase